MSSPFRNQSLPPREASTPGKTILAKRSVRFLILWHYIMFFCSRPLSRPQSPSLSRPLETTTASSRPLADCMYGSVSGLGSARTSMTPPAVRRNMYNPSPGGHRCDHETFFVYTVKLSSLTDRGGKSRRKSGQILGMHRLSIRRIFGRPDVPLLCNRIPHLVSGRISV